MPERDDLIVEVPFLGSANQDDTNKKLPSKLQVVEKSAPQTGNHWIHTVLILLLIVSVGSIVYWGYDFKQDQEQRELLAQATESRIAELEQLLADSQAQAKKSGQTLQQRLDEQFKLVAGQKKLMDSQYVEYEKKFAILIENAGAKQAEQLAVFNEEISKIELKVKNAQEDAQEEMGFMTSQQKTALAGLEDRLAEMDALRTSLTNIEISQTQSDVLLKGFEVDLSGTVKDTKLLSEKLVAQIETLKQESSTLDGDFEKYKASSYKSIKSLSGKISAVARKASPKLDASVITRLAKTENAIRAIDGTRAQVNKEIQRLKGKVNKIQLQLQ